MPFEGFNDGFKDCSNDGSVERGSDGESVGAVEGAGVGNAVVAMGFPVFLSELGLVDPIHTCTGETDGGE